MSHLVLARKYRPRTFDQVVGQETIVATLKAALLKDRMAHALLFTGSRGIGKTTIARIVAKALVCLKRNDADPCGSCPQCVSIDSFSSLDIMEIDGASHTGVDDIRELRDCARYQPSSAKFRIFIIDEVHMLSTSAFNALLKIIEEPPPHVLFIFATTEAHKIPKTILSRCQRYDFKRVGVIDIVNALKLMLEKEGFHIEDDGLLTIAELADGGMRDALSMAEQVLALGHTRYTAQDVAEALGVVSHQALKDVAHAIINGQVGPALAIIQEVYVRGYDLPALMDALTERFRILSLCAHLERWEEASALLPGLKLSDYECAQSLDKGDIKRLFAMALDAMASITHARKPLLACELFILRAAQRPPIADAVTINWCLQKLDALMHNRPLPKEPSLPESLRPVAPKPVVKAVAQEAAITLPTEPEALFTLFVTELAKLAPGLSSHLRHARPVFAQKILQLHFELSLHHDKVQLQEKNSTLLALLTRFYGPEAQLSLVLEKKPEHTIKAVKTVAEKAILDQALAKQALHDQAANHPLVKKALEIFGGDITKVERIDRHEMGEGIG